MTTDQFWRTGTTDSRILMYSSTVSVPDWTSDFHGLSFKLFGTFTNIQNTAFICYRKGQNDLELISITNENSMFKAQARYLLERADAELWSFVLSPNNIHRRSVVDQVISTAVPESTEPDKVSVAVQAFLAADMPAELIDLLEKVGVLRGFLLPKHVHVSLFSFDLPQTFYQRSDTDSEIPADRS